MTMIAAFKPSIHARPKHPSLTGGSPARPRPPNCLRKSRPSPDGPPISAPHSAPARPAGQTLHHRTTDHTRCGRLADPPKSP